MRHIWLLFTLIGLLSPSFGYSDQNIDRLDFKGVLKAVRETRKEKAYASTMQQLRQLMRDRVLGNIWQENLKNPNLKLGHLKTTELFKKLESFDLFQNTTEIALQADRDRRSDFYAQQENWGVINKETLENANPEALIALTLHVFLGAAGYEDDNYQLGLMLIHYNNSIGPSANEKLRVINFNQLFPRSSTEVYRTHPKQVFAQNGSLLKNSKLLSKESGGGFTGVGGGGDILSLQIKQEIFSYVFVVSDSFPDLTPACRLRWRNPTAYAADVFNIEIESDANVEEVTSASSENGRAKILIPRFDVKYKGLLRSTAVIAIYNLCEIQQSLLWRK